MATIRKETAEEPDNIAEEMPQQAPESAGDREAVVRKPGRPSRWRRMDVKSRNVAAPVRVEAEAPAGTAVAVEEATSVKADGGLDDRGLVRTPYIFDMETGDPDDILTLLFLASHPAVELRAVTITPGNEEQVALVRWILQQLDLTNLRIGAQGWPSNAKRPVNLDARFYQSFGRAKSGEPRCERADQVLLECCDKSTTLVTGAPLHNLGDVLKLDGFCLGRWVAQGGFAGEGVVPREQQMDKFKGMETCRTWNFGGNIPAAQAGLGSTAIARKICVSKNVCHDVVYDDKWHRDLEAAAKAAAEIEPHGRRASALRMMYDVMNTYLRHKPGGKKLHDPLALAVALDESVCELKEVELFTQAGQWGSRLCPDSNIWISVAYDMRKFKRALLS